MTTQLKAPASSQDELLQYRALSTTAVVSLVLGVVSVMAVIAGLTSVEGCLLMLPLPAVGLALGVRSYLNIRRRRDELTGLPFAAVGTALSLVFLIAAPAVAGYVYATEVPDGYQRISFAEMKPDEMEQAKGLPVPPDIQKLDGEQIFIKGYMRPSSQSYALESFLLVRDNNQCCFGPLNKVQYFDQMQVHLVPPLKADYSMGVFRVAGTLRVDPRAAVGDSKHPVFTLTADHLQ